MTRIPIPTTVRRAALMLGLLPITACSGLLGPEDETRLGVISFYDDPLVITVPDTVSAGAPFELSVRTYGGGCIRPNGTLVQVEGRAVTVAPYDVHSGHDYCPDVLRIFDHDATVTLHEAGLAEIRIRGRSMPADSTMVVVRHVVVLE